ncbi:PREDICTED: fatty acyl-CoA reductase 1-like [Papilio polytes]|uniref:fatty acyl-CoA reductase 1-like n=1 Tax=Papilio polytes TaxID=76194 RepID=UPI0006762085|nr:PREDICTED: fatty acyl-CoA reductase 1-like [Papilio polytes]
MLSKQEPLLEAIARGDSPIQRFYTCSKIFITGGSGFIGKLIIEKIFRACNVDKIYILIRSKKNMKPKARLSEILKDPIFSKLHTKQPDFVNKIIAIEGDLSQGYIGMNNDDWNKVQEVDIIFHVAANIRFDGDLKEAIFANVRGTREVLKLGKCCKNLRAFVHVSTAFTHAKKSSEDSVISERFYESPGEPEAIINITETWDDEKLKATSQLIIGDWPNTYTMSKALADELVRRMAEDMPICIVKPSLVISTLSEPSPGWLDMSCVYGATGFLLGLGLGLVHIVMNNKEKRLDIVPADMVANAIIVSAWDTAKKTTTEPKIYTITSNRNPITWDSYSHIVRNVGPNFASPKVVWSPFAIETKSESIYLIFTWLLHFIPAYIIDSICFLMGKPRKFVKLYEKVYKANKLFSHFIQREWFFCDKNLQELYKKMCNTDRIIFNFNIDTVNMQQFITVWIIGIRKYIIKDGLQGTEYAKKKMFWLDILNYITLAIYALCWWKILDVIFWSTIKLYNSTPSIL